VRHIRTQEIAERARSLERHRVAGEHLCLLARIQKRQRADAVIAKLLRAINAPGTRPVEKFPRARLAHVHEQDAGHFP
jgi:hypothetical protein